MVRSPYATGAALCIISVMASPLFASERTVGSTLIRFSAPAGQCEVTGATPAEAFGNNKMRELFSKIGQQLLSFYADCAQLAKFRASASLEGSNFTDFAQYVVLNQLVNSVHSESTVAQVCASYRTMKAEKLDSIAREAASELGREKIKLGQPKFLGVLAQEPGACYVGTIAEIADDTGASDPQVAVGIIANVLVKGKLITYQGYASYRGSESVTDLLVKHKANVAAFKSINAQ